MQKNDGSMVVVSGMRPTGSLHLGHYFGALQAWKQMQAEAEQSFFFAADWHALTTHYAEPNGIPDYRIEMFADWLACGLDPDSAVLFYQSDVPQHAELYTLLGMIIPIPWLERVPSYKEVRQQLSDKDLSTIGFMGYPLLQTADIAVYNASHVPVGEDQLPHLELSREVVRRFNHLYGGKKRILREPQGRMHVNQASARLPGVDGRKMSKSYDNAIYLSDGEKQVEKKILRAMTDPARVKKTDPGDPEKCPMFQYQLLFQNDESIQEIRHNCTTAAWGCVQCKRRLLEPLQAMMAPIREKREQLVQDKATITDIADAGGKAAREAAEQTMQHVRRAIGMRT